MRDQSLIVLTGPTAVGKTRVSISLAKAVGGEIISADSMQVYRHMDIGSAKITPEEMQGVPHYLVDVLEPSERFDVVRFQSMAKDAIRRITAKGRVPILVGGTGFYIQSVLYDIDFTETKENEELRKNLALEAKQRGSVWLHEQLACVDPESAAIIAHQNVKRVIRALEFYYETGTPISEHNRRERQKESPYRYVYFVLNDERPTLYRRIDRRVDEMMERGLVEEVRGLKAAGCNRSMVSMQGLGYKEILDYLDGKCSLEEAVYRIKRDSRHFAKRQITWFKRERNVTWIEKGAFADDREIVRYMCSVLEQRNMISGKQVGNDEE
ncbi:MAG: tRNA (adenosine(37)-N6)-dimethylallyltransferase MiaA [Lachnospiraceae bacterium]